jgi:DNA-binding transcriptional MerR regulator/effector-binding domain-containing protein
MRTHVTIGDFSRATHLTVKTLRHYHEVGLLEPAEIDPDSGYRYYSNEQIPMAQVIKRLRGLDMPVPDVKAVVSATEPEARNRLIVAHLNRLEDELTRTRAAVGELRSLLDGPAAERAIEHRTERATPALAVSALVAREEALTWWQGALGELGAAVRAQGLEPSGPPGGMFASELFQDGRGEATVFIPVAGEVRSIGRVAPLTMPGAELAVTVHRGGLSGIDIAYGQLAAYVMSHEIAVDGPLRERYPLGLLDTPDSECWETEIGWPVFRADGRPCPGSYSSR